jgi:hypothetical protein
VRGKVLAAGAVALVGCGISIGRDLREVTPQTVIYDDVCKVQDFHDGVESGAIKALPVVNSSEFTRSSEKDALGGITTFAFETEGQLTLLRRILNENWKNLPEPLMKTSRVELQVKWAEKAGARLVVTTEDPVLTYEGKTRFLPYHICLSELLFGGPLY